MISKTLSTFAVVAFIAAFVAVDVDATPKADVAAVNQLRSMAAPSAGGRNKRASYSILPGHLRYEEANQRRVRKNDANAEEAGLEAATGDNSALAGLTTDQLYRMLDLLNRIENQEPVDATPHELATLNFLLQSYQN